MAPKEMDKVLNLLKKNDIEKNILNAIAEVDRTIFFDEIFADKIYSITEQTQIGKGENSEDLLTLARMIQRLDVKKGMKLLEVGTGSGYSTAILGVLASSVVTVDIHEDFTVRAKSRLIREGFFNVKYFSGDASEIEAEMGEFDRIAVFSGCVKRPIRIMAALKDDGQIVFPMGPAHQQQIVSYRNSKEGFGHTSISSMKFGEFCTFKSIRGIYGWIDRPEVEPMETEHHDEGSDGKTEE